MNTVFAGVGAIALGAAVGGVLRTLFHAQVPGAFLMGGGIPPIAWVLATVLIWRETAAERVERISAVGTDAVLCPVCGYNMTGLREARCPECGAQFTLDQLLTTQPHREAATLPRER